MTGYEIVAAIMGVALAVLFLIYGRAKQKPSGPKPESSPAKPDIISQTAGGIFKVHNILRAIIGIAFITVVLLDAVSDQITRIVVLSTIFIMLLISFLWALWLKTK